MTFLVDTNVLSEGIKPLPDPAVLDWLRTFEEDIVVDFVILGEVLFGVLKLPHTLVHHLTLVTRNERDFSERWSAGIKSL